MERDLSLSDKLENYLSEYRNWSVWSTIILGQILSILLCIIAYISHYLTNQIHLHIPTCQNYMHYMLLCSVFTTILACRKGDRGLISVIKSRGYRYILIGFIDLQANTLIATSYQFTTALSIQRLDGVAIPVAVILSCLILGVRYRLVHMIGIALCLIGFAGDMGGGTQSIDGQLVGDMLCLGGGVLFAVVTVLQELAVKTLDCVEYLGMLGLCGSLICGFQMFLLERHTLLNVNWENKTILIYLGCLAIVQTFFYGILSLIIKQSGATATHLYLLTADFYAFIIGILLWNYKLNGIYFSSFLLTMTGIFVFMIKRILILNQQTTTTLIRHHTDEHNMLNNEQQLNNHSLMHQQQEHQHIEEYYQTANFLTPDEYNNSSTITREYITPFNNENYELSTSVVQLTAVDPTKQTSELTSSLSSHTGFSSFYRS